MASPRGGAHESGTAAGDAHRTFTGQDIDGILTGLSSKVEVRHDTLGLITFGIQLQVKPGLCGDVGLQIQQSPADRSVRPGGRRAGAGWQGLAVIIEYSKTGRVAQFARSERKPRCYRPRAPRDAGRLDDMGRYSGHVEVVARRGGGDIRSNPQ